MSHTPKGWGLTPSQGMYVGCRFDPQLGPVMGGNQLMFLSHTDVLLALKINKIYAQVGIRKIIKLSEKEKPNQ